MTSTIITLGLDTICGMISITAAVLAMLAIGASMEIISYARNPYLRQRRAKIVLNKMHYAFA